MIPFWAATARPQPVPAGDIANDTSASGGIANDISAPGGIAEPATTLRHQPAGRQLNRWIVSQLRLQPYQYVLEVGCGAGHLLEETARNLRIGFLAGVESVVTNYQQAYRRNRRFMARQLMQLHLGELHDLPYPPHYFHTVYSTSAMLHSKDPQSQLLRLIRLLRSGGRLVLLFHSKAGAKDNGTRLLTQQIQLGYIAAGLLSPEIATIETAFGATLLASAIMP